MTEPAGVCLRVEVLGPLRVLVDGEEVTPGGPRRAAVLALLAVASPAAVSAASLVDDVWGDAGTDRNTLQSVISRVRRDLGRAGVKLSTTPAGYLLVVDELDAAEARRYLAASRHLDPSAAVSEIERALILWRGDALPELRHVGRLHAHAVALDEERRAAGDLHLRTLVDAGRASEASTLGMRPLALEPLREPTLLVTMEALAVSGRAPEALRLGHDFRTRLADETGLEPSEAYRTLEALIVSGAAGPDPSPSGVHPHPSAAPPSARWPGVELVGRSAELSAVAAALGSNRLVTIVGTGGVGKTSLAEAVVRAVDRPVARVELAEIEAPEALGAGLARGLGLGSVPPERLFEVAHQTIGDTLLLLDNAEHLLGAVRPLVERLLAEVPRLTILATSREPLGVSGEHVERIQPLDVGPEDWDPGQQLAPAVELFVRRVEAADRVVSFSEPELRTIRKLCGRLDGLPLAIELAAGRCTSLGLQTLVSRVERALDVVSRGARPTGRHGALAATIGWSYDLLPARHRQALRHLALLPGGFTLATAEVLLGAVEPQPGGDGTDVAGVVAHLVEASMLVIRSREHPWRYGMLETIRSFCESATTDPSERASALAAVVDWSAKMTGEVAACYVGPRQVELTQLMAAEIANIRSVLRSEDDQVVRSGRQHEIAWSLREPLMWWAPPELADDVVALSERPGAESRPCWQEAFAAASQSAFLRGEFDRSARLARRVLESSPQDPEVRSFCRLSLATVALYRAEFEQAASLYLLHDEIEPPSGLLAAGALALHYGRAAPEAGEIARRAVQAAVARGGPAEEAFARASLGEILSESAPDAALTELQRAVALADERYSGFAFGIAALNLATLLQRQGNHQEALAWYPRLIAHWQRSGSWPQLWTTLRNLAELLAEVGDGGVALALLDAADRAPTATSVSGTAAVRVEALRARGSRAGDVRASGPAGPDGSRIESSEQAVEVALAAIARHTDRTPPE